MIRKARWLIALLLCLTLLSGCSVFSLYNVAMLVGSSEEVKGSGDYADTSLPQEVIPFESMEYTRPDPQTLEDMLHEIEDMVQVKGQDPDAVADKILDFYDAYDSFVTNCTLADIHNSADLTDSYWSAENAYCMENSATADAMLDELYYMLAACPMRETLEGEDYFGDGFFDAYDGESAWDAELLSLMEKESDLETQYYALQDTSEDLDAQSYYDTYADDQAQVLVDLVRVRNQIARYMGYADYPSYASDYYYSRDYTEQQVETLLADIRTEIVPLYRQAYNSDAWLAERDTTESETLAFGEALAEKLGGQIWEAYSLMRQGNLYDIGYSAAKYNSSFEIYLTSYAEPYLFMDPMGTTYDWLTFVHEFGHYCNDYASGGSYVSTDVAEFFSQGMEYLSLCYGENAEDLVRMKMADSVQTYVEQACYADFEQQIYGLSDDELTVEGLYALYGSLAESYGFDAAGYDNREFVTVTHFYTNPMYIVSYIVSNDAALQMYSMELEEPGSGLACYTAVLDTEAPGFMSFLEEAGLASPFDSEHIHEMGQLLKEHL